MLPSVQSVEVAEVIVSSEAPHRLPALAMIDTLPAFRVVIITPPVVGSVSSFTMLGSEALQSMLVWLASMPVTTAGTWNVCTPSYAEYIGEKTMLRAVLGQPVGSSLLDPPVVVVELSPALSVLSLLLPPLSPLPPLLLPPPSLPPAVGAGVVELELLPQALLSNADPKTKAHASESIFLEIAMQP